MVLQQEMRWAKQELPNCLYTPLHSKTQSCTGVWRLTLQPWESFAMGWCGCRGGKLEDMSGCWVAGSGVPRHTGRSLLHLLWTYWGKWLRFASPQHKSRGDCQWQLQSPGHLWSPGQHRSSSRWLDDGWRATLHQMQMHLWTWSCGVVSTAGITDKKKTYSSVTLFRHMSAPLSRTTAPHASKKKDENSIPWMHDFSCGPMTVAKN